MGVESPFGKFCNAHLWINTSALKFLVSILFRLTLKIFFSICEMLLSFTTSSPTFILQPLP